LIFSFCYVKIYHYETFKKVLFLLITSNIRKPGLVPIYPTCFLPGPLPTKKINWSTKELFVNTNYLNDFISLFWPIFVMLFGKKSKMINYRYFFLLRLKIDVYLDNARNFRDVNNILQSTCHTCCCWSRCSPSSL